MIAGARNYKDSRKWPGYQGETFYARTDHTPRQLDIAGYIYISTIYISTYLSIYVSTYQPFYISTYLLSSQPPAPIWCQQRVVTAVRKPQDGSGLC